MNCIGDLCFLKILDIYCSKDLTLCLNKEQSSSKYIIIPSRLLPQQTFLLLVKFTVNL